VLTKEAIMNLPALISFMTVVSGFALVPSLCQRYKIPGRVGLILAGGIGGRSGLDIWPDAPVIMSRFPGVWMLGILRHAWLERCGFMTRNSSSGRFKSRHRPIEPSLRVHSANPCSPIHPARWLQCFSAGKPAEASVSRW
jgi:hypothetical protein